MWNIFVDVAVVVVDAVVDHSEEEKNCLVVISKQIDVKRVGHLS